MFCVVNQINALTVINEINNTILFIDTDIYLRCMTIHHYSAHGHTFKDNKFRVSTIITISHTTPVYLSIILILTGSSVVNTVF